jgi:hypothetical protein
MADMIMKDPSIVAAWEIFKARNRTHVMSIDPEFVKHVFYTGAAIVYDQVIASLGLEKVSDDLVALLDGWDVELKAYTEAFEARRDAS